MSNDWQMGDLALCVDATRRPIAGVCTLREGAIYRVSSICTTADGLPAFTVQGEAGRWLRSRFRKIRPDEASGSLRQWKKLLNEHRSKVPA